MIPRRYVWLLRDESGLFETTTRRASSRCKLCCALERPGQIVAPQDRARHLAAHRAEKITADDPEAATIAAATERT